MQATHKTHLNMHKLPHFFLLLLASSPADMEQIAGSPFWGYTRFFFFIRANYLSTNKNPTTTSSFTLEFLLPVAVSLLLWDSSVLSPCRARVR